MFPRDFSIVLFYVFLYMTVFILSRRLIQTFTFVTYQFVSVSVLSFSSFNYFSNTHDFFPTFITIDYRVVQEAYHRLTYFSIYSFYSRTSFASILLFSQCLWGLFTSFISIHAYWRPLSGSRNLIFTHSLSVLYFVDSFLPFCYVPNVHEAYSWFFSFPFMTGGFLGLKTTHLKLYLTS